MRIDGLGEGTEFREGVGFANMGDFVLDSGQEPMVQLSAWGSFAPLDTGGKSVEVGEVLHYALVVRHVEIF